MIKKIVAFLLSAAFLVTLSPAALCADARDTEFFQSRYHADVDFSEMEYVPVDVEAAKVRMDGVRALAEAGGDPDAVLEGFLECAQLYRDALTMYCLVTILFDQDVTDKVVERETVRASDAAMRVQDALYLLARDILNSPSAEAIASVISAPDQEYLRSYEATTEEAFEASSTEEELSNQYWSVNGGEYENDGGRDAALGELFLDLVSLRVASAAEMGYDSYTDYAYESAGRDYTKEEMRDFHAAVKEYIVPVYHELLELYYDAYEDEDMMGTDYTGEAALKAMDPVVAALSDEMYEAFTYMRSHGLYDSVARENKAVTGYTITLPSYGSAFFFDSPYEYGFYDLKTAVHEFGHYNNDYWMDDLWYCGSKSIDVSEVHSQALELLFSAYYPQIYGYNAQSAQLLLLLTILDGIIDGALHDELQQYAYETEGLTVQMLDRKFCALEKQYGILEPDDPATEDSSWVEVNHTFSSPLYYISYAVSAAGAFAFWLEATKDYYGALDDYLRFTALDLDYGFQDSFAEIGMESPITPAYLKELADALRESGYSLMPFSDVDTDQWFYDAVYNAYYIVNLMNGTDYGLFTPDGLVTRAMAVTTIHRLVGTPEAESLDLSFSDVPADSWYAPAVRWAVEDGIAQGYSAETFGSDDPITRQDLAVMLYRVLLLLDWEFPNADGSVQSYADAGAVASYAAEAMGNMSAVGIINGSGGLLRPESTATRAELAQMMLNLLRSN